MSSLILRVGVVFVGLLVAGCDDAPSGMAEIYSVAISNAGTVATAGSGVRGKDSHIATSHYLSDRGQWTRLGPAQSNEKILFRGEELLMLCERRGKRDLYRVHDG